MKKDKILNVISIIAAIAVIVLGVTMIAFTFIGDGHRFPRVLEYVFWALAILNGVLLALRYRIKKP